MHSHKKKYYFTFKISTLKNKLAKESQECISNVKNYQLCMSTITIPFLKMDKWKEEGKGECKNG